MKHTGKIKLLLLTAALGALLLGSCGQSSASEGIQASQPLLAQQAQASTPAAASAALPDPAERFTGDWTGVNGLVTVHADAAVLVPESSALPMAEIARRAFTLEDAQRMLDAFLKGNPFYQEQQMTQQEIEAALARYRAMERGEIPLEGDSAAGGHLDEVIAYYTERCESAPEEGAQSPAALEFVSDGFYETLAGYGVVEGKPVHLHICNVIDRSVWDEAVCYVEGYGNLMYSSGIPVPEGDADAGFSEEEAIRTGQTLMDALALAQMHCDSITPLRFPGGEAGYEMVFVRSVNGLPIRYTPGYLGIATPEDREYPGVWANEVITVCATEDGVVYFHWSSPHTQPVVRTEACTLMDFSDITEIFAKMIMVKNSYLENANAVNGMTSTRSFNIDRVELNLMRVREADDPEHGLIVPVWDFRGTSHFYAEEGAEGSVQDTIALTVNAIDGSVIDRELGY